MIKVWSTAGTLLGICSASGALAPPTEVILNAMDLWQVQLATGEIRTLSLDELDAAYQAGVIQDSMFVLAPGAMNWVRLADALGDDASDVATPFVVQPYVASPFASQSLATPVAFETSTSALPPASVGPTTLRPMVSEIAESEEELGFKPRRSGSKLRAVGFSVLGLALVGGLGFEATKLRAMQQSSVASLLTQTGTGSPAASPAPEPPVVAEPARPSVDVAPQADNRLSDAQRRAVIEADKARAAKQKARTTTPHKGKSKSGFLKGGDPHDPLNGSL